MGNRTSVNLKSQHWFSVFCTFIENDISHHTGQNFVDSRGAARNRRQTKRFFQFVTIAWHVDASSFLCTLINNGKLANQILTLLPFVEKRHFTVFLLLLWILEVIAPATLVQKQIWTKIMLFLLVGHSAGALPLCLPNNYQRNSKTRQCFKTEEKRSSLYFVEDGLRELRKIKSTGLFSILDKKYLKCKKFKITGGKGEGTVPVTCKSSCCESHYRPQLLPNSVETPRPLSIRLRGFLLQEVQFSC